MVVVARSGGRLWYSFDRLMVAEAAAALPCDSTACKCRTGNQKCWTKCARIYQSKRRAESPRSEQILPDILKQSSEIDDIIYEDILDNNQRNSADSPNLEELLDSLPFPWRRNIYRLIQKAEMAELENFL
nr:uncharacterized protein LOC129255804 [Lytechinus pictus]